MQIVEDIVKNGIAIILGTRTNHFIERGRQLNFSNEIEDINGIKIHLKDFYMTWWEKIGETIMKRRSNEATFNIEKEIKAIVEALLNGSYHGGNEYPKKIAIFMNSLGGDFLDKDNLEKEFVLYFTNRFAKEFQN